MVNHIWSILCRKSVIDNETNNLSMFDVLEQISVDVNLNKEKQEKFIKINVPIDYEVISFWVKPEGVEVYKGEINIEVVNPDGKVEKAFAQPLDIPEDKKRLRSRMRIKGFVAEKSGVHIFRVSYKDLEDNKYTTVAEIPFEVILNKKQVDDIQKKAN